MTRPTARAPRRGPDAGLRRRRRRAGPRPHGARRPHHRSSSARTPAASRRSCAGLARLLRPRAGRRACWTARRCTTCGRIDVARVLGLLPQSPGRARRHHGRRPRRARPLPAPGLVPPVGRPTTRRRCDRARGHGHRRPRRPAASPSCRAASASGSGSRWPSPRTPTCSCSTSRRRSSTSTTRSSCSTCSTDLNRRRGKTIVIVLHDLNPRPAGGFVRLGLHLLRPPRGSHAHVPRSTT